MNQNTSDCCGEGECSSSDQRDLPVDLDFYENELAKMQQETAMKAQKKASYEQALAKLEEYKGKMK
jgi:hypothetical protein